MIITKVNTRDISHFEANVRCGYSWLPSFAKIIAISHVETVVKWDGGEIGKGSPASRLWWVRSGQAKLESGGGGEGPTGELRM